jgi:hypothetical protein
MGRKRIHPLDPIKAAGLKTGTVIENPQNGETYTIGQRGRRPPWVINVLFKTTKTTKILKIPKTTAKGWITIHGPGSWIIQGKAVAISSDVTMEFPENSSIIKVG